MIFKLNRKKNRNQKLAFILDLVADYVGNTEGMRILDLGSDGSGSTVSALVKELKLDEATGVNPAVRQTISGRRWKVISADARDLPYPDESFDLIVSVAAFEHFFNLDLCLKEAHRVLRKNGKLVSRFGPIWSGLWGHHLWVKSDEQMYTFQNTMLPPWCHLLQTREELAAVIADKPDPMRKKILSFVYDSEEQNRLFYSDYEKIFVDSDFDVIGFEGVTNSAKHNEYDTELVAEAREELKLKYPGHYGFDYDGIEVVLEKTA